MNTNVKNKTKKMAQLAILTAIMLVLAFTPLGYLKVGIIEITFMVLPVAIGAVVCGPSGGAILGAVFGITSFLQCFGMSALGTFLFGLDPTLTLLTCLIPRVLCGWLAGLIFKALNRIDKTRIASYFAASLSAAVLNTLFFMLFIVVCFWQNPDFVGKMNEWSIATDTVWAFLVGFVGINGVVEAVVNFIAGGAIAKAVTAALKE